LILYRFGAVKGTELSIPVFGFFIRVPSVYYHGYSQALFLIKFRTTITMPEL
jgi:hypothetical protein